MNVSVLPDDILHAIFRQLYGTSILKCRSVCRRWKEAVDSLSERDWRKICNNDWQYDDYEAARSKYGLSWRETFKALHSWGNIGSAEMLTRELCDNVLQVKVLPGGIIACLKNLRHKAHYGYSDTIVYYDTNTFQECGKQEYSFAFSSRQFDENEYLLVVVLHDGDLCIISKENNQKFIVGSLDYGHESLFFSRFDQFTLIEKEVYFKNAKDEIIYVSKLTKENGVATIETKPLEAFLENHESFEDCIVGFSLKNGKVHILSDEGNKGNIYIHENADFSWAAQPQYDQPDLFAELQEYGFNWKLPPIYHWLSSSTNLFHRPAFYSHGSIYLTTRSYGKTVCIHYWPNFVYGPEHLLKVFKSKPQRRISVKDLLPASGLSPQSYYYVNQLDIIETGNTHKLVVLLAKKVFILEFPPGSQDERKLRSSQGVKGKTNKSIRRKKVLQAKKKSIQATKKKSVTTKGTVHAAKKTILTAAKKKSIQAAKRKSVLAAKKKSIQEAKNKLVQTRNSKSVKKETKKPMYPTKKKSIQPAKRSVETKKAINTKRKTLAGSDDTPYKHSYSTRSNNSKM